MASVYGFQLEEIPEQDVNEVAVSSTKIRHALQQGNMVVANRLLGHDFTIHGTVVQGDRIGRTIGFPTANIQLAENYKQLPKDGIYAVMFEVEGLWYKGMLYIGMRPVVHGNSRVIEVNIFDFDQEIYGKQVCMRIKERIRDDRSVDSLESLKILLEEDRVNATKILS
jgi:riboflavin kinase/FMN adenylyltransferase